MIRLPHAPIRCGAVALLALAAIATSASAQDRLKTMPGYEQHQKMAPQIAGSAKLGNVSATWVDEGKAVEWRDRDGKRHRYDFAEKKLSEPDPKSPPPPATPKAPRGRRNRPPAGSGFVERGRQYASAASPDGKRKAVYRDRNLWITDNGGKDEVAVTTDGNEKDRVKNGSASWTYGEELFQNSAMWWSPDSSKVAFYRFDEKKVKDYYLALKQTAIQDVLNVEPYVKVGGANPVVDILVYDVSKKETTKLDSRDGKPFEDADSCVGHYLYGVEWSPDGKELIFHRTNRRQNVMELVAADPATGKVRVIVHEEWPASWVENTPGMRPLKDEKRFLWESERNGFKNFYLYNYDGTLINPVTQGEFEVGEIVRIDEDAKMLYYMGHDGDNPMKMQLHRVGLDGKNDKRLTDPAFHHQVDLAPDAKSFVDVMQTHDTPPATKLLSIDGEVLATLGESDLTKHENLGFRRAELLTYKAADGKTDLYGILHKPSNFDPSKKYPVLVSVYGGPATNGASENFAMPSQLAEYGFLVASLDSRSAAGRGKKFLDAIYKKLGQVEMDDQAEGVKSLWSRPYVDKERVGIFGTSYGGTSSGMCLLRFPDVFRAACAMSAVTDFRNYDSIYTERYMSLPEDNKEGYDKGSLMTYAGNLKGRLMIFYGTADDNVHPANALQLIQALQRAGKSFEVQVGPDMGHSALSMPRMMEFFIENLVMKP
jgi:dipeptidyl-peptidase 4